MIPFIDLQAQQRLIKPQLDAAIARVLDHGIYIMGPEVTELEKALCEFVGAKHCITVSNGTDALVAAYMALGVGPGDAVITTPFTFYATVEAIQIVGATPVFADVDPQPYGFMWFLMLMIRTPMNLYGFGGAKYVPSTVAKHKSVEPYQIKSVKSDHFRPLICPITPS